MDEATSNIDQKTDEIIQLAIRELLKSATVITIAHRLETIKDYDRIVVIEDGRITETGSWEKLKKKSRMLANLIKIDKKLL